MGIREELPPAPSDMEEWILDRVAERTYLIVDNKKHKATCTRCGNTFIPYKGLKHNMKVDCPACDYPAIVKSVGYGREGLTEYGRVLVFVRKGKTIYASLSDMEIKFTEEKPKAYLKITDVYKLNANEQKRETFDDWKSKFIPCKTVTIPSRNSGGFTYYNRYEFVYVYDRNLDIFDKTDFKYADVKNVADELSPKALMKYLNESMKYQSFELLRKTGYMSLIKDRLENDAKSRGINWRAKELKKILKLENMGEVKKFMNSGITQKNLEHYKVYKNKYGYVCADIKEIRKFEDTIRYTSEESVERVLKYMSLKQAIKYLHKQNEKMHVYADYIRECEQLELDLEDKAIKYPKDLKEAHSRTSTQIKVLASAKASKKIKERAEEMNIFDFEEGNLLIRVAKSAEEIIEEGQKMGHCVGGYVEKVADGKTNIFFVREKTAPDKEFYTLELKPENKSFRIVQCRGHKNCSMTEEVETFINDWFKTVVKKRKVA